MDEALALQFVEFDPLARFGGDRDHVRTALLLSGAIRTEMEDRDIADPDLEALIDIHPAQADLDALRTALDRLRAT